MRTLLSSLSLSLLVTACGGPPPPPMQPPVVIPPSTTTNSTNTGSTSQNVMGTCNTARGTPCGNGKGICIGTPGAVSEPSYCVALAGPSGCPRGSFSAEYEPGKRVCLDLCARPTDCSAGFVCGSTVLSDESGTTKEVSVCMPGVAKKPGAACVSNSTCGTDRDLECIIPTGASVGICTKSCTSEAQCGGAACSQGGNVAICIARCGANGTCEIGLSCRNGLCIPQSGGSNNNSPGSSAYPTPGFGALGGSCSDNNDCEVHRRNNP